MNKHPSASHKFDLYTFTSYLNYLTKRKTISVKKALEHLVKGGCLYVVVYIGHDQGKESTNLDAYFRTLDHKLYNVAKFEMMNKNNSPYVVIIEKR